MTIALEEPWLDVDPDTALLRWERLFNETRTVFQDMCQHKLSFLPKDIKPCFESANTISAAMSEASFRLVERNLRAMYVKTIGWEEDFKRAEMLEQPTRYILLQRGNLLVAFLSMQLVDEEGGFVLYCYEVQVDDSHQGQGLGKWLMDAFHLLAQHHRLARTMLTCFSCNTRALAFYKALGYELDSTSPEPRRLRNKLMQPDYQILTRVCKRD